MSPSVGRSLSLSQPPGFYFDLGADVLSLSPSRGWYRRAQAEPGLGPGLIAPPPSFTSSLLFLLLTLLLRPGTWSLQNGRLSPAPSCPPSIALAFSSSCQFYMRLFSSSPRPRLTERRGIDRRREHRRTTKLGRETWNESTHNTLDQINRDGAQLEE